MANRYGDAPIIFTRTGIGIDTFLAVGEKYNTSFTRDQFAEVTQLKITSLRDKLRDLELYGFIKLVAKDTYTITDEGKAILAGGSQRSKAIEDAVNRSPLWKRLIADIGKSPDRALFDKTVKSIPSLSNIDADSLDNLWSAYNSDIQCITKSPPFSSRQPVVRKLAMLNEYVVVPKPVTIPASVTQGNGGKTASSTASSHDDEQHPNPGKVEYRGHVVIVTDDLTARFAESLVKKMIKDLKRQGVEFDE